jgi:hypothetical protein
MRIEKLCLVVLAVLVSAFVSGTVTHAKTMKKMSQTCVSGYKVTLELSGDELVVYKPFSARFTISDASGKPVPNALLFCSLYMPEFATGTNRPTLKPTETSGVYEGVMLFSQSGAWSAGLTLNLPGGVYEELVFEIGTVVVSN